VVERMRTTLARVLAEPAWARRLRGVHPGDIVRVEDWRTLPFLTKEELRDAYPYGLACVRAAGYHRIQMSSGTTGNPILNPYTASDVAQWGEVMARCYVAAGPGSASTAPRAAASTCGRTTITPRSSTRRAARSCRTARRASWWSRR